MSISSIGIDPEPDDLPPNPEALAENANLDAPYLKDGEGSVQEAQVVEGDAVSSQPDPEPPAPKQLTALELILDRITPVQQTRPNLKILVYSDPGMGKSTLLGGAPNNLIVDVERGLASLNNHPDLLAPNVKVIPYKSFPGFELLIETLQSRPPELADIETLSIDSMSELHKRGLAEVTERDHALNPMNNRYVAETGQHTENNEHIRRLVSALRDLPLNLIMTAHARTIEPKNRPAKTFPDFSEKLANTLAGIVDIVAYMYMEEIDGKLQRVMRLHSDGTITAKTRIGGYPETIVDPTWDKLWNVHQNSLLANKK